MKEQLREKFYNHFRETSEAVWTNDERIPFRKKYAFDWFWQEIEKRDKEIEYHAGLSLKNAKAVREIQAEKIKLEERIKELEAQLSYYADQNQNQ